MHQSAHRNLINQVNLILIVVFLAAYLSAFFDPQVSQLPSLTLALVISLGLVYLGMGVWGWQWYEQHQTRPGAALYFGLQLALVTTILLLCRPLADRLWILFLPLTGQGIGLSRPGSFLVAGFVLLLSVAIFNSSAPSLTAIAQTSTSLAAAIAFVMIFTLIAVREGAAREEVERLANELGQANQQLRQYAQEIEALAIAKERYRLAREIHDSLGHYLTALNMQLGAAQAVFDSDRERALLSLGKAQQLAQDGLADVRRSVAALRELPTNQPLPQQLEGLIAEMRHIGIVTQLEVVGNVRPVEAKVALTLYRVAQEGLTNVRKHARASSVQLTLDYHDPQTIRLCVADNGVGSSHWDGGFGLLGLNERVQLLGGQLTIETAPNQGFRLQCLVNC